MKNIFTQHAHLIKNSDKKQNKLKSILSADQEKSDKKQNWCKRPKSRTLFLICKFEISTLLIVAHH